MAPRRLTAAPRLAFLGTASVQQGLTKVEVTATLFAEGDAPSGSFFGHYEGVTAGQDELHSGGARIRFSDGSEADAVLAVVDQDTGGFRIHGHLESSY